MKKHIFSLIALFFVAQWIYAASVTAPADIPAYYSSVDGKSGSNLWSAISSTANKGFSSLGYNGLWTAYKTTDTYPTDPNHPDYVASKAGKIWDMYGDCNFTYGSDQCGSYNGVCDCYNREHSIPKSWFGGSTSGIGCDIFHLVPTDGKINGVRTNDEFGEVNGGEDWNGNKSGTAASWSTDKKTIASAAGEVVSGTGRVFEPLDKYKGDFARGYMGTIVKWQLSNMTSGNNFFSGQYDASHYFGFTKKAVVLMMKWHREDPVSQKEIDRNNGIQKTQGNRNPFIDYPYLAEYIWGEKAGEEVDMAKLMPSTDEDFIPGVSNGWRDGSTPVDPEKPVVKYGVTWSVNGEEMRTDSIEENKKVEALPDEPVSCSTESSVFMGWTVAAIEGSQDEAPAVLYAETKEFPAVTEDVTYYAVFAKKTIEEGAAPAVYTYNAGSQDGWENTASKTSDYWLLDAGKALTSPAVDLSGLKSIQVKMRTYGGTQFDQFQVAAGEQVLTTIEASKGGTMNDYEWINTSSLSGTSPLTFTCSNASSKKGIGFQSVTINATGAGITYSRYITICQTPTELETIGDENNISVRKILVGGQLFILRDGHIYNVHGARVR